MDRGTLQYVANVNDDEWPLPERAEEVPSLDGCYGRHVSVDSLPLEEVEHDQDQWEMELGCGSVSDRYMRFCKSDLFSIYRDTVFKVGGTGEVFSGHRLFLSVECGSEGFRSLLNKSFEESSDVLLPDLNPQSFRQVLEYLYGGDKIDVSNPPQALGLLKVAATLGIPDLQKQCSDFLIAQVDPEHVIDAFCLALDLKDVEMKEQMASFITRNANKVLSSDGFLNLSKANLKSFLQSDDWFIADEFVVLNSVIRWASHNRSADGSDMRKLLGDVINQVRITELKSTDDFLLLSSKHNGLFTEEEVSAITTYISSKLEDKKMLPQFNNKPRGRHEAEEVMDDVTSESMSQDRSVTEVPLTPINLTNLQNDLREAENTVSVDAAVFVPSLTQIRVFLPNLREFHLKLVQDTNQRNTTLKSFMKPKMGRISDILFFDTEKQTNEHGIAPSFVNLLRSGVNVTITCSGTTFLKINHTDGVLLMNLIPASQQIMNSATGFPLKKLLISDCNLSSLKPINTSHLEEIVMKRVKGVLDYAGFLQTCSKLTTVALTDLASQEINLNTLLCKNPQLRKLSLASGNLLLASNATNGNSPLQEFYIDNCSLPSDSMDAIPRALPHVKRMHLYGTKTDTRLLYHVLQMPSLEWLCVWDFGYHKVRSNESHKRLVMTEDSTKIHRFLVAIFGSEFAGKSVFTFILEKKRNPEFQTPFDAAAWEGTKLTTTNVKYSTMTKLDYRHFCYDQFFSTYEDYLLFEKTEADLRKESACKKNKLEATSGTP